MDVFNESASLVCTRFGYMLPTYLINIDKPTINKGGYIIDSVDSIIESVDSIRLSEVFH